MEQSIFEALKIGGTPGTIVLGGILLVRWMNVRFNGIDAALNAKQSEKMCDERHGESCRRLGRLENAENGAA